MGAAITLVPTATTLLVNGQYTEGGFLTAVALTLISAYDHFDNSLKLPDSIDEETFVEIADDLADTVDESTKGGTDG